MSSGGQLKSVYLDYAAATPLDPLVLQAMEVAAGYFYNPSALYLAAREARELLHEERSKIANIIGANSSEIILTAGATEANNLAIKGVLGACGGKVLVSAIEHEAVVRPSGDSRIVPVNEKGIIELEKLAELVDDETSLISIIYGSNEIGTVQPLREVAAIVESIRKDRKKRKIEMPIYLHTDASQAAGYLETFVNRLGVDLMTINGGKIYGPKMSGCLYVKAGAKLVPIIDGGGQEFGLRSGTESLINATGLAKALELAVGRQSGEGKRLSELRNKLWESIDELGVGGEKLGHPKLVLPHILSVRLPGVDNERLVMEMDECGVMIAAGSACKASSDEPSTVLKAIGLTDEQAGEVVRFSLGRQTTESDIIYATHTLSEILTPKS